MERNKDSFLKDKNLFEVYVILIFFSFAFLCQTQNFKWPILFVLYTNSVRLYDRKLTDLLKTLGQLVLSQ